MTKSNDKLATLKSTDRHRAALLLLILAVGAALTWRTAQVTEERMRAEMLVEARIAAQAVNVERVLSLSGSEEDLRAPDYVRLKEQLARMRHASPRCRFLYLMGRRADGVVFFFVDSLPPDSEDYAPPGLVYEEVSDSYLQAFDTGQEAVVGPVTDRWGTLVTALVPLTDPQTEELVAVLGMDVEASGWNRETIRQCLVPFAGTLVLVILILILAIAAQRQQIRARRESEERWRSLTETSPDHILTLDADLNIQFANFASPGLTVEELIGTPLYTYVEEERQAEIKAILEGVLRTGDDASYETIYHRPDGTVINYESRVTPRRLPGSDEIVGLTLSARDITARKRAEEALRTSKEIQDAILSTTDVLLAYLDSEFNFIAVNQAYADAGRRRREDFVGKNHFDLYPHAENEGIFRKAVETGETQVFSAKPFEHPDQPERGTTWWDWSLIPLKDESGSVRALVFSLLDVTERVQAKEALRESEERFRLAFENANIGMCLVDLDGRLTRVNSQMCEIFGYSQKELEV